MNDCIEKINLYLHDDDTDKVLLVNVDDFSQKKEIFEQFNVESNTIVRISDYAKKDSLPNVMELLNNIKSIKGNVFVFGVTTYLSLVNYDELINTMNIIGDMSVVGKVVFVCFHCQDILAKMMQKDLRISQRVVLVTGDDDFRRPRISLISKTLSGVNKKVIDGIENLPETIEDIIEDEIFVSTKQLVNVFSNGLYAVRAITSQYQLLLEKFPEISLLSYIKDDEEKWCEFAEASSKYNSLRQYFEGKYGEPESFQYKLIDWNSFSEIDRWQFFVALKVIHQPNKILNKAIEKADTYELLIRSILRSILEFKVSDKDFEVVYNEWRSLIGRINIPREELLDYCEYIDYKGKEALYYLSDQTKIEREKAIKIIGQFQAEYEDDELKNILKLHFHKLYDYVMPFDFGNELLDKYFGQYAMQKLRNTIYPDFAALVKEEATEQHYVELPSRTEIVDSIGKENSILYFVDALGVEFLNYIMKRAQEKKLFAVPRYGKCNLPSITECNKEFVESFRKKGAEIVDIKKIDKDKHEAVGDYSFTKTEYPIHLLDELDVIDQVISDIVTKLDSNSYSQAYIISDHGASRLAVINKSILPIESMRTGAHGGRVCENNELTKNLKNVIHEGNLCILAEYDRFDGSRPASVETHGGATLEEVTVPIICFTKNHSNWEIKVLNTDEKVVFSFRTDPVLVLWSKTELPNMSIKINGKIYRGEPEKDKKTFRFVLDKPESVGKTKIEVFVSNNLISDNLFITFEREGMKKSNSMGIGMFDMGGTKK